VTSQFDWPKKVWEMNRSSVADDENSSARRLRNTEIRNSHSAAHGLLAVPPQETAPWSENRRYGKREVLAIASPKSDLPLEPALGYCCRSDDKDAWLCW